MSTLALALSFVPLAAPLQESSVDTARLVQEAQGLVPQYTGEHRSFLTARQATEVTAAVKLLEAAMLLAPEDTGAPWWLAHARTLLGEDRRNRGDGEAADTHYSAALVAIDRSLELDPGNFWAHYSRGTVHTNRGESWSAIEDFGRAVELANDALAGPGAQANAPWLRFFARKWRCEALMRAHRHERAREEWRSFYADNGNNAWDLGFALAQSHLRERDLAGAAERFDAVIEAFPNDFSARAERAYVAGLVADREGATRALQDSIDRELEPTLYPRIWLWIVAVPDERRAAARADLAEFLANPPASLSNWDTRLGRFLLGAEGAADFLAAAEAEAVRRMAEGIELDDLPCEAAFYAGLRLEEDGDPRAVDSYRTALASDPLTFKWEWAYARLRFARLAEILCLAADPGFTLVGDRLELGAAAAARARGIHSGTVADVTWHVPGAAHPASTLDRDPRPGDLFQAVVRADDGRRAAVRLVVDGH